MSDLVVSVPIANTAAQSSTGGEVVVDGAAGKTDADEQPQTNSKPRIDVAIVIDLVS